MDRMDRTKRYSDGSGIALVFVHYDTTEEWVHDRYYECDTLETVCTGMVVMRMVGDDSKLIMDPADLTEISDEDYCSQCGQIGCTHDGR